MPDRQAPPHEPPTWLVLHGPFDPSVGPLLRSLRERLARSGAPGQVLALSLPVLMGVLRWRLWLDDGGTRFALGAPDGAWALAQLRGVINRLPDPMPSATQPDSEYPASEWRALLCAWLNGLSEQGVPVHNRARPDALCGGGLSRTVWRARAAQGGLPVPAWQGRAGGPLGAASPWAWWDQGEGDAADAAQAAAGGQPDLLLVGARCLRAPSSACAAAWPEAWERPLRALARQAQCTVLGVQLCWAESPEGGRQPVFSGAQPCPDLRAFGPPAWDALGDAVALPRDRDRPAAAPALAPAPTWATLA